MRTLNSSEELDLEALNLSMTRALMPTIIYMVLIMLVGTVGNVIVLLVYYRRFKPSSIRTYILAMSVCDLLTCVISLPGEILAIRYHFTYDLPLLCKSDRIVNYFLVCMSAFILVAVATDRFAKVCLKKQLPMKRVRINVLVCALSALAFSIVCGILSGSSTIHTDLGKSTGVVCSVSDVYKDTMFPVVYYVIMTLAFFTCVLIIAVSYTRIALELRRHKQRQKRKGEEISMVNEPADDRHHHDAIPGNASGPGHDLGHSETSSPGPELFPQKSIHTGNKTLTDKTASFGTCGSDQKVQVSFEGLSLQQSRLSVSDNACCSQDSKETLSASPKDQKTDNTHDEKDILKTFQKNTSSAMSYRDEIASSNDVQAMTSNAPEIIISEDTSAADDASSPHVTKPGNDKCTPHPQNIINRLTFMLGRLLPRMTRHDQVQIGEKPSTVKAIPSSTTVMMFVLAITFLLINLPYILLSIMSSMSTDFSRGLTGASLNLFNIGMGSFYMNCAINGIVYSFCSPRFRHECRQFFARKS